MQIKITGFYFRCYLGQIARCNDLSYMMLFFYPEGDKVTLISHKKWN